MTVLGVDYSHYQCPPSTSHPPDVRRMKADGIEFVILKAWEGSSPDPNFTENLAAAQAANMPTMAYVFLHSSDDSARMRACLDHIGDTVLCLDWEADGVPARVVEAWMDVYEDNRNRQGMIYYGLYPPDEATPRIGEWPRWFAEYNSYSKLPAWEGEAGADWRYAYAIWQNSDKGRVDGIEGNCDMNQLAPDITIDMLCAWLADGSAPLPPHKLDLVKLSIRQLQRTLNRAGYDAGTVDGLWGPHTQKAVEKYSGYTP